MSEHRYILLLVKNNAGVLHKITGLFVKRGINIETINSGECNLKNIIRITVTGIWDEYTTNQLIAQLKKLFDVLFVKELESKNSIIKELAFIKIELNNSEENGCEESKIKELAEKLNGKILEITDKNVIVQFVESPIEISNKISSMRAFKVLEILRTGSIGMNKGMEI